MLTCALAVVLQGAIQPQGKPLSLPPAPPRFERTAPLSFLDPVFLDASADGYGLAQQAARSQNLQGRILWIDATANLERVSSKDRIEALFAKIADSGFNTVVYDVKPIVGYTTYPSKLTSKITEWRGQKLPIDFDPLSVMVSEAKKQNLSLLVSMNVFSEVHRYSGTGPGYSKPDLQTVQYEPSPIVRTVWPKGHQVELVQAASPSALDRTKVGVLTEPALIGNPSMWAAQAIVNAVGIVQDRGTVVIPKGGSCLVATGGAPAEFLERYAIPGASLEFATKPRFARISENQTQWPLMMNPHRSENQQRALDFVREVLTNYSVDGILFDDRLRFGGLNADFSEYTRSEFEKYVGKRLSWPQDVYEVTVSPALKRGIRPGRYYDAWLSWRALTIRNWVARARSMANQIRPKAMLGVYAGSWLGEYDDLGSNYSSPDALIGIPYFSSTYRKTGYAPELDILITGCYYNTATIFQALADGSPPGQTVEAGGQLTNRVARDQAWSYAGIQLSNFVRNPRGLEKALQGACGSTQGVMVFDLSHDIESFWETFKKAFRAPAKPPHDAPGLLDQVRRKRATYDRLRVKEPPIFLYPGAPGIGQ